VDKFRPGATEIAIEDYDWEWISKANRWFEANGNWLTRKRISRTVLLPKRLFTFLRNFLLR